MSEPAVENKYRLAIWHLRQRWVLVPSRHAPHVDGSRPVQTTNQLTETTPGDLHADTDENEGR